VTMCNLSVRKWMSSPGLSRISWAASPLGCDINRLGSCRKWNNFISTFTSLNVFSGFFLFVYWKVCFFKKHCSNLFHVLLLFKKLVHHIYFLARKT
jgi:hypothetical protein